MLFANYRTLELVMLMCMFVSFKVDSATEDKMTELTDEIFSCGYHGPVNVEKKEEIVR